MKTEQTNRNKAGLMGHRPGLVLALAAALIAPATAHAKISDWFNNVGSEFAIFVTVGIVVLGGLGVLLAGFGLLSAGFAKKNREPLQHQGWFIGVGTLLILLVPMVMAMSESITGDDTSGAVESYIDGNNTNW